MPLHRHLTLTRRPLMPPHHFSAHPIALLRRPSMPALPVTASVLPFCASPLPLIWIMPHCRLLAPIHRPLTLFFCPLC